MEKKTTLLPIRVTLNLGLRFGRQSEAVSCADYCEANGIELISNTPTQIRTNDDNKWGILFHESCSPLVVRALGEEFNAKMIEAI